MHTLVTENTKKVTPLFVQVESETLSEIQEKERKRNIKKQKEIEKERVRKQQTEAERKKKKREKLNNRELLMKK